MNAKRDDIDFVWIGGGEKEDVDNLEAAGVRITGMIDRSEALTELSTLDIYFQTSAYEGLSLALLEAQASGVPAVVTKIPGNDEVVQHGETGFVGESEDQLMEYLEELINSEVKREELGKQAKKNTEKFFSLDAMADQYKAKYKEMVEHA